MSESTLLEIAHAAVRRARELGASDAAAHVGRKIVRLIRFSNNEVTAVKRWDDVTVQLLVKKERRVLLADLSEVSVEGAKRAVEQLVERAPLLTPAPVYAPLPDPAPTYPKLTRIYDPEVGEAVDRLYDAVATAINAAQAEGAERVAGSLYAAVKERVLVTSAGVELTERSSYLNLYVRAFADAEASGQFATITVGFDGFNPERIGKRAGWVAVQARNPVDLEPGKYTVLFSPMVVADYAAWTAWAASALAVLMGYSWFREKLGQKVAADNVTILEDPLLDGTPGATAWDLEGVPTQRKAIVEGGVLRTYLHNVTTAAAFQTRSTGNAGWVFPEPFNVVMSPGTRSCEDLIASIDRGVFITNVWYTRFQDYVRGDFSSISRDGVFLIKNGSIEQSLKKVRVSDNMLRLFQAVREVGRDRFWVLWWGQEIQIPAYVAPMVVEEVPLTKPLV